MEKFEFKEATPIERDTVITRDDAIQTLFELINSGILSYDLTDKLEEIANNIEMEKIGYHFWGADPAEKSKIFVAIRAECITVKLEEECEAIDDKYSFVPSHFEQKEIEANICGYAEEEE